MVTNPKTEPAPPTTEEKAERTVRSLIAGHPQGAMRRIVLYVVCALAVGLTPAFNAMALVALVCIMLLGMTDELA